MSQKKRLTEGDHEAGVHLVPRVLGRVAVDAAIGPEVVLVDFRIVVARERLEHLRSRRTPLPHSVFHHPYVRYIPWYRSRKRSFLQSIPAVWVVVACVLLYVAAGTDMACPRAMGTVRGDGFQELTLHVCDVTVFSTGTVFPSDKV